MPTSHWSLVHDLRAECPLRQKWAHGCSTGRYFSRQSLKQPVAYCQMSHGPPRPVSVAFRALLFCSRTNLAGPTNPPRQRRFQRTPILRRSSRESTHTAHFDEANPPLRFLSQYPGAFTSVFSWITMKSLSIKTYLKHYGKIRSLRGEVARLVKTTNPEV